MPDEFLKQKELIAGICQRLGIDYKGLADAAGVKAETMRKWAKGYAPMPNQYYTLLPHIENLKIQTVVLEDRENRTPSSAHFDLLETETLQKNLIDITHRLAKAMPNDRKYILSNLRSILDVLEERELKPVNSERPSKAGETSPSSPVLPGKNP